MVNVIIENLVEVVAALLLTVIGVVGTWATTKIAKKAELSNIGAALNELFTDVTITVAELQQTVVEGLKSAADNGKLSEFEIKMLGNKLYDGAIKKLSPSAAKVLNAAGMDIAAIVKAMGEQAVLHLKE